MAGGSGCGMLKRTSADEEIIAGMEEKYGEDFRFAGWQFQKIGSRSCTAYLECDSMPGKRVKAGRRETESGEYKYFDDYMAYKYEDDIQEEIASAIRIIYPESKVILRIESSEFPSYMGPGMSVQEILEDRNTSVSVMVIAAQKWKETQKEAQAELLRQELEERKIRLDAATFITEDKSICREISWENHMEWAARKDWYKARCDFALDVSYEFYYADWSEGDE